MAQHQAILNQEKVAIMQEFFFFFAITNEFTTLKGPFV